VKNVREGDQPIELFQPMFNLGNVLRGALGGFLQGSVPSSALVMAHLQQVGTGDDQVAHLAHSDLFQQAVASLDLTGDQGQSLGVSYSVDDSGAWSPVTQFLPGKVELVIPMAELAKDVASGVHTLQVKVMEAGEGKVRKGKGKYRVNKKPRIATTASTPLQIAAEPTDPVDLPVVISDDDGKPIGLLYRLDSDSTWNAASVGLKANQLQASAFEGHLAPGEHSIEVYGHDFQEMSSYSVTVKYVVPTADNSSNGLLSPVGLAGIIVGGVALVAIVVGAVVVVVNRRRKEKIEIQ
jgi:hypothetical protein